MEYSFDINSETEKFELYYLKCIFAGRAHKGFYIVYPSKMQRWSSKKLKRSVINRSLFYLQFILGQVNITLIGFS